VDRINVLQSLPDYLNITEFWAYRLLYYIPDYVNNIILSRNYFKRNFYIDRFTYIEFPIKKIDFSHSKTSVKLYNYTAWILARIFLHRYVKFFLEETGKKIDILHSHFGNVGWDDLKLAKTLKVPHIVSFYGVDYLKYPKVSRNWRKRYKELFLTADLFICEGSNGKKILVDSGCPEDKIVINRLGVDVKRIPFFKRKKKKNRLRLLQISSFREKKGHIYTVKAFKEALKECPDMHLTLVGDGETKDKIIKLIKELHLQGKVDVLPSIFADKLHRFMKNFDVFIHPSCHASDGDCEGGAPVVLLDAQATGLPIISTTHCDIPEEVIHGKTGFLAPEKDINSLVKLIKIFYEMEQDEYNRFSEEARKHVEKYYDIEKNSRSLADIYAALIKNERR